MTGDATSMCASDGCYTAAFYFPEARSGQTEFTVTTWYGDETSVYVSDAAETQLYTFCTESGKAVTLGLGDEAVETSEEDYVGVPGTLMEASYSFAPYSFSYAPFSFSYSMMEASYSYSMMMEASYSYSFMATMAPTVMVEEFSYTYLYSYLDLSFSFSTTEAPTLATTRDPAAPTFAPTKDPFAPTFAPTLDLDTNYVVIVTTELCATNFQSDTGAETYETFAELNANAGEGLALEQGLLASSKRLDRPTTETTSSTFSNKGTNAACDARRRLIGGLEPDGDLLRDLQRRLAADGPGQNPTQAKTEFAIKGSSIASTAALRNMILSELTTSLTDGLFCAEYLAASAKEEVTRDICSVTDFDVEVYSETSSPTSAPTTMLTYAELFSGTCVTKEFDYGHRFNYICDLK
ncbi:hypothetical protein M885DRAFT_212426 [Pelagophyceae sp. CCMP2097]|nr:hypothetical protein M885DRAFT_212426 [Pelagophyceae sp. CCMP2097]